MIQRINVYSYLEMRDALPFLAEDAKIVGCADTGNFLAPLFSSDSHKLLLVFDDCLPGADPQLPMSAEQALQVVRYLSELIDTRVRHDLHVHCVEGQARSAAVAKVAAFMSGLEAKYITSTNQLNPNQHVETLLIRVYRDVVVGGVA